MKLVIGGAYQGKLEFAKALTKKEEPLIAEGEHLTPESIEKADIVSNFHLYIRRLLENRAEVEAEVEKLLAARPQIILTVTQLGCGIVPAEAFERNYRERVGRICCELAKEAQEVYQVTCGIGMPIK